MHVLQAGDPKLLLLELDPGLVSNVVKQTAFDFRLDDSDRALATDLSAPPARPQHLLLCTRHPAESQARPVNPNAPGPEPEPTIALPVPTRQSSHSASRITAPNTPQPIETRTRRRNSHEIPSGASLPR